MVLRVKLKLIEHSETLQGCMRRNGMEDISSYDHSACMTLARCWRVSDISFMAVLSVDDASLLAMEFNRNPVIDDEAAFDICAL